MFRSILALALAFALLGAVTVGVHAQTAAITVTPGGGNQFQTFTVAGTAFTPGTALTVTFVSPDGEDFPYLALDGSNVVLVAGDGTFSVTVVPAVDFAGARAGKWTARVCTADALTCWTQDFTVSR
jgi:hypothetical protein